MAILEEVPFSRCWQWSIQHFVIFDHLSYACNRLSVARRIASNIHGFRSVHRTLCSNTGVKIPGLVSEKVHSCTMIYQYVLLSYGFRDWLYTNCFSKFLMLGKVLFDRAWVNRWHTPIWYCYCWRWYGRDGSSMLLR